MKRKSLIEAMSQEARDFIEAGTPKPQFVQTQPEKAEGKASPALVPEPLKTATDPAEKREIPASVPVVQQPADGDRAREVGGRLVGERAGLARRGDRQVQAGCRQHHRSHYGRGRAGQRSLTAGIGPLDVVLEPSTAFA